MIRSLRFLDEYLLGSETAKWYRSQISTAREFVMDGERLKDYVTDTTIEMYFFVGFGRIFPDIALGHTIAKVFSGEANNVDYVVSILGEIVRFGITASQRLDRRHVREYNLSRTIEEETADHEPLIMHEDDFEI